MLWLHVKKLGRGVKGEEGRGRIFWGSRGRGEERNVWGTKKFLLKRCYTIYYSCNSSKIYAFTFDVMEF